MTDLAQKIDEIAEIASQQWFKDCLDPTKRHIDQVQLVKANCKSAIYAGLEEALKMEPSVAVLEAGAIQWCKHNHGDPYDRELPDIFRAMRAAQWAEIEERK
jgi:hypothetical protein